MQVIKRDNTIVDYDIKKIINVLKLAFENTNVLCYDIDKIIDFIEENINQYKPPINIEFIQDLVELALMKYEYFNTAKHYINYRNTHNEIRKNSTYIYKIPDDVTTPWGMLGYITYKRTYARIKNNNNTEEFRDTILRVLDASQKQLHIGFTNQELKDAYKYFMSLKCLPSGRVLWQLGTETVNKLGLMSLQNCAFININDPIISFTWIFDVLMLGSGVGFNIQKYNIDKLPKLLDLDIFITRKDTKDADFIIPDSREGWVAFLEKVLEAFFYKGKSFTYSTILIRCAGEIINGFGGIASGPSDLVKGIDNIQKILKNKRNQKLTSIDCLDIVNIIASIVVSGNIRRSATIAIGDYDDIEYLKAKRWDLGNIPNWRCMSNNSVVCNDISKLPNEFWEAYKGNGEPYGLINIDLSRKIGRIKDGDKYPDPNVEGYNPCFTGDTFISVADVRQAVTFKELAAIGKDVLVYSINKNGIVEVKYGRNPRITGVNQQIIKIHLDDDTYFKCTLNHKFQLINGEIIEAKDLKPYMCLLRYNNEENEVKINENYEVKIGKICEIVYDKYVIKYVELLEEKEDVYNITVDDNHNYAVITKFNNNNVPIYGVFAKNCGEISLSNASTCNLAEIFLSNIESFDELKNISIILYRICKHISMLKCHHKNTEQIIHSESRIGLGITGFMQSTKQQKEWLSPLYEFLREYDIEYSKKINWVPSIKLTTCKPSGTLSLLAGVTPGAHPGIYQYFIRRIRISSSSNLINLCKKNGYFMEYQKNFDGTDDINTMVVEFPCKYPIGTKLAKDMTAINQLETVKEIQTNWSDNAVSITIYYRLQELDDIKKWLLNNYTNYVKSCSFLLHNEHGFKQAPYEEITKEDYYIKIKKVKPIISGNIDLEDDDQMEVCKGRSCPIK